MKKLILLLLMFSFLFASVRVDKTVNPTLYPSSAYDPLSTDVYAENVFKVSTTAMVIDPAGGSASDLGNNAIICPGEVTLHSKIYSKFAINKWSAFFSVAYDDDNPSDYTDYGGRNSQEFVYSSSKYSANYKNGEIGGLSPFPTVKESVDFSPKHEQIFYNKEGYAGGVINPKITFFIGGSPVHSSFLETNNIDYTTNLQEGSYELSSQLELLGVLITVTRDHPRNDALDRTGYYSLPNPYSNDGYTTSLPKATIHIDVVNANNIEMKLVSREPQDPVPIPTDMTIVVKNEGQVPIKVIDASITSGYSISKISGFNEEIPVGNEHQLKVHIDKTNDQPPSSATITLKYQSVRPTCDGQVKTKDLNFAISTQQPKKPDLFPKITATLPVPFYEGSSAGIKIEDCNQFMKAGAHNSNYSIKTNDGQNIVREETVQVGPLQPGQCQPLYNAQVACTKNIIVTACVDVKNEVQEEDETNNCKTDTYSCSGEQPGGKNCTIIPSYAMFIPPSSKYFELLCGLVACSSADWKLEDLDEHVSASVNQYGATVYADAEAPPQKGKLIADAKDSLGENYKCSSVIDIIKSKCEDFV